MPSIVFHKLPMENRNSIWSLSFDLLHKGLAARDDGEDGKALKFFHRALQKNINFVPALIEMAILYDDLGYLDKAMTYYERALNLDPEHYELRIHYANALIRDDQVENGIREIRKVIEQDENKPDGWYYLGVAYFFYLDEGDKALAIAEMIVHSFPEYLSGYTLLGEICFANGDVELAKNAFNQALQLDPDNKDAHLALSAIYGNDLLDREQSLKHSLTLLKLDPLDKLAQHNAEMALSLPTKDNISPEQAAYEEGMAYIYLAKWDKAEHALKRAMKLNPSHPQVWQMLQEARHKKRHSQGN